MNAWDRKLVRDQLDSKIKPLQQFFRASLFEKGWIRVMREALGMSATDLGKRVGVDQSRISRLEKAEVEGEVKLSTLRKIAAGMNMQLVYGFIPEGDLEDIVKTQARKIAHERLQKVGHTMRLEDQELSEQQQRKALDDLIQKILIEQPKDFWRK